MASLEGAEGEAIPAAVEHAREDVRPASPPLAGAEGEALDARVSAALEAAERRHAAYLAGLARRDELAALVQEAEALAGQELAAARAALHRARGEVARGHGRRRPARPAGPVGGGRRGPARARPRGPRRAGPEGPGAPRPAPAARRPGGGPRREGVRGGAARRRPRCFATSARPSSTPATSPPGKDRDVALARLEAARKHLYPLVQQLREDAEWKRWANVNVQEELCAEAEALLAEEDLEKAASALRDLDARWKQAKEAPKDKAEALWTRFKAARDQVKAKTDAFLAKQAEELAANLKKKEALCERAEALAGLRRTG